MGNTIGLFSQFGDFLIFACFEGFVEQHWTIRESFQKTLQTSLDLIFVRALFSIELVENLKLFGEFSHALEVPSL